MILTCSLVMIGDHCHVQCVKVIQLTWRRVLRTPLLLPVGAPQVSKFRVQHSEFQVHGFMFQVQPSRQENVRNYMY